MKEKKIKEKKIKLTLSITADAEQQIDTLIKVMGWRTKSRAYRNCAAIVSGLLEHPVLLGALQEDTTEKTVDALKALAYAPREIKHLLNRIVRLEAVIEHQDKRLEALKSRELHNKERE